MLLSSRYHLQLIFVVLIFGFAELSVSTSLRANEQTDLNEFSKRVQPFLAKYCISCHGEKKQKAKFFLHDIDGRVTNGKDVERWEKTLEMLSNGDMPPEKAKLHPEKSSRREVAAWIRAELKKIGRGPDEARLTRPKFGNRVDHEELFSGKHQGPAWSPSRLWRKSPQIHTAFERSLRLPAGSNPFNAKGGEGFQDYSLLEASESTIKAIQISAKNYISQWLDGRMVHQKGPDGKHDRSLPMVREGKSRYQEFHKLVHSDEAPTKEDFDKAVERSFQLLLYRSPTAEELERYSRKFLTRAIEIAGARDGLESLLTAIILSTEFIYRQEIGLGQKMPDGRRMLSPTEIAYAIAFAITDSPPDNKLKEALKDGRLQTKVDVEREVRRMLEIPDRRYWDYEIGFTVTQHLEFGPNPRVLRFFREFFGYHRALDVFKDKSRNPDHKADFLVKDAELFVLSVLEKDRDVLKKLLTSDQYIVHYAGPERVERALKSMLSRDEDGRIQAMLDKGRTPVLGSYRGGHYFSAYGFEKDTWNYPIEQPFTVEHRAGILTHPAWLVAHSGNFDTDPIRRGKWIREHLLADTIPEIPIGVDAKLEEDPHKTIRERLTKTTEEICWRCHKKMNPLGLPFEAFDDFGRYRKQIVLGDADAFFQKKRRHDGNKKNLENKLREWRSWDAQGRAAKVAKADKMLAGLKKPEAGTKNFERELRGYENNVKRWTREREKWLKIDDAEQQRQIESHERRIAELVAPVPEASKPVNTQGRLTGTGNPKLDGEVQDAFDLVRRLGESRLARQSFVRHAFRYWMGRNEMLTDSPTLIAADKAYVENGGSFKELLVTLLTSDSFLLRK